MESFFYKSSVGIIKITANDSGIVSLNFEKKSLGAACRALTSTQKNQTTNEHLKNSVHQLDEYFSGKRTSFDLPLAVTGTPFQKKVWNALRKIPHGQTVSYADIARRIGQSKAFRAVGGANNKNPVAIIVPCHRVVGKNGDLTGYAGGLAKKKWLIHHEKSIFSGR
jgi:methylated-DNA-[protein]-cysteine S-methyltransferase